MCIRDRAHGIHRLHIVDLDGAVSRHVVNYRVLDQIASRTSLVIDFAYAQRWMELDPEDENAPAVIRECKAEIRRRQRSRNKKAKFVPGTVPSACRFYTPKMSNNSRLITQ